MSDQLQIQATPESAVQVPIFYSQSVPANGAEVGTFYIANKVLREVTAGQVYEVNLNVVKSFTAQLMPGFNPILLLVFDSNANPKLGSGLHFLFAMGGEWTIGAAPPAPGKTNYDVSTNFGLRGSNQFGPLTLPGDYRYFRAYIMTRLTVGGSLNFQTTQFTQTGATQVTPWDESYSFVTFYGK